MNLPQFYIQIDIDIDYSVNFTPGSYVAASNRIRGLKLPYTEYSELRDYIRSLFLDKVKFRTLGFKPSDNALLDKERLTSILPLRETNPVEYEKQIAKYLETEPQSKSFYIVADALDTNNTPISRWILDVRISNHSLPISTLGINNQVFLDEKYKDDHKDAIWLPVRFKITYNIKHIRDVVYNEYQLDIVDRFDKYPPCTTTSIDTIKDSLAQYVADLWENCNNKFPIDSSQDISFSTYIQCSSYNKRDINIILSDIENYVSEYNKNLCNHKDCRFRGYHWTCVYADVDADNYITQLIISDNFGETFSLDCDIYIPDYFDDKTYQEDTLFDVCIALLEGYGPDW